MYRGRFLLVPLLLNIVITTASALTERPFVDYRVVCDDGTHYVVIRRVGNGVYSEAVGPVELLVCEAQQGNRQRIQNAHGHVEEIVDGKGDYGRRFYVRSTVGVRDGDRIVKRLELQAPPNDVRFSEDKQCVVCVGIYGHPGFLLNGHYPAVQVIWLDGRDALSLKLESIFDVEETQRIQRIPVHEIWYERWWLMEVSGFPMRLILVGRGPEQTDREYFAPTTGHIRMINLSNGECKNGELEEVVVNTLYGRNAGSLKHAIELAEQASVMTALPALKALSKRAESDEIRRLARAAAEKIEAPQP